MRRMYAPLHLASPNKGRRWRLQPSSLVPAVLCILGSVVLLYPHVAAWMSQYEQSRVIQAISNDLRNTDPAPARQLQLAEQYNRALAVGAILEVDTRIPTGNGTSSAPQLAYEDMLRATSDGLMGRVRIPRISLDLPIYHGTSDQTLLKGVGHLKGTSLPIGGVGTRTVLTGHRGLASAEMFTRLDEVGVGDTFTVETFGEVLTYRVVEKKVVEPHESEALRADASRDLATLVTCTPLGINSHRILLTGQRVLPTPAIEVEKAGKQPEIPGFPWWIPAFAATVCLAGGYVWWAGRLSPDSQPRPRQQLESDGVHLPN